MYTPKELALRAAKVLDDRKGLSIKLLEVADVTSIADYFLICTGTSGPHVKTLCDSVEVVVTDELGEPLLHGDVLNENVGVEKIREYVYFTDTKASLPESHPDEPYFMGVHIGSAYYFYYEKQAVTTLNREFLHTVKTEADAYVIYADLCTLSEAELEKYHITFKKIPRDITKL